MTRFEQIGTEFNRVRNAINRNNAITDRFLTNQQAQIDKLVAEGDSSPQAAAASVGADGTTYASLKSRLDTEQNAVISQLAHTMSQEEFDGWVATLLDGGPSIFFDTYNQLVQAYPQGASGIALIRETDPAKIYVWVDSAWKLYGDYQGIEVKDKSITRNKLLDRSISYEKTDFVKEGKNLFDGRYVQGTIVGSKDSPGGITSNSGYLAFVKVEPNSNYTISKTSSNRFRVALAREYPVVGDNTVYIVKGNENDTSNTTSIRTRAVDSYIVIYTSLNSEPPEFMQVERGSVSTEWETYGLSMNLSRPLHEKSDRFSRNTPEFFGAIGDANYIHSDGTVWTDSSMNKRATDDTVALQKLFDSDVSNVCFPEGKKYRVTKSLILNPTHTRNVEGNGATIIGDGDFIILDSTGGLLGSANPTSSGQIVFGEHGLLIAHLKVTSANKVSCTGIRIRKNFGLQLLGCSFNFVKCGISVEEGNRNLIFNGTHVYACIDTGILFKQGGDLHQINIVACHISYNKRNLFSDDHNIYNMQITGCDIETSSYPTSALHNLHFKAINSILEDIEIVGNTIEDHWNTEEMIRFEGSEPWRISAVTIAGNVIGNSNGHEIYARNCLGFSISGNTFKASRKHSLKFEGKIQGFNINGNTFIPDGGGLLYCAAELLNVKIDNNVFHRNCKMNPIVIISDRLEMVSIHGNSIRVNQDSEYDMQKGVINVTAQVSLALKISDNIINATINAILAIGMNVVSEKLTTIHNNSALGFINDPFLIPEKSISNKYSERI